MEPMNQALALEILLSGQSTLLTGPAGSGKTHVLNQFIRHAKAEGKTVAVTATTGLAATHVGGSTIHAWSGIGIHRELPRHFGDDMHKGRRDTILATDVLVIDEISMLHDFRLDMVDEIARTVRERDEPFGGIQVVLCGDFFQLPPVSRGDEEPGKFVVESSVWEEMNPVICYLNEQHRQDDDSFLDILQALRASDIRRGHVETLLARVDTPLGEVTELHTTNIDVDSINNEKLAQLDSNEHIYTMSQTGKENYVESLKRSCLANETLTLKKGALVMMIKNSPEKRYVNGSLGTVVDFEKGTDYPIVLLKNGRKITVLPDTWELRDGDKKRASLSQLPLRLAWAITIHKSQGMTLDAARIDLRRAFVEGMGYVALSRVRSLDTLSLAGINRTALKVSPDALAIDSSLREQSQLDAKRFSHLQKNADERAKKPPAPAKKDWSTKLKTMRQKYPNAYKPWSEKDDKELLQLFSKKQSVDVEKLTKKFGRHPGSIRARLKKHFGDDAVS
jgi:ATP-dependent DNA helicase PIF1